MNKEFVTNEVAISLKNLGFNEDCMGYYSLDEALFFRERNPEQPNQAPLYQHAFRWFRENHNTLANVYSNASGFLFEFHDSVGGTHRFDSGFDGPNASGCWDTYEEAEIACIGVLCGYMVKEQLAPYADFIKEDAFEAVKLIEKM